MNHYPLPEIILNRRSIRAFDKQVPNEAQIISLIEAARWAPSSSNNQPWRYIYATQNETEKFGKILSCLVEANQLWAGKAPLLILSLAKNITNTGKPYRHNLYDTGAANMALAFQANNLGMQAHIMGGFDADKAKTIFEIETIYEPVVVIAVGFPGDTNSLPKNLQSRENQKSERFEIDALILK